MIIAVDFDGTLHLGQFPAIGIEAPDAAAVMNKLKDEGHYLIINTARDGAELLAAINWLLEHGIPFDRVNDNHPGNVAKYGSNSRKVYAHLYVDDRQVGGLPPWADIYTHVTELDERWKQAQR
ncbi:MAG: hypothetical protein EOM44_00515 [Bacteroidia bacterium]|nr:hypothetical protein [Bacteroidia bacterium]